MEPAASSGGATVVAPTPGERALVWVGFPLIGAGAGWLLTSLAGWATSLPWVPFQGRWSWSHRFPTPRPSGDLPDAKRLQAAFAARGYPWASGGDPHKDEYRALVEDLPDLPAGANAILKARARALDRGDK